MAQNICNFQQDMLPSFNNQGCFILNIGISQKDDGKHIPSRQSLSWVSYFFQWHCHITKFGNIASLSQSGKESTFVAWNRLPCAQKRKVIYRSLIPRGIFYTPCEWRHFRIHWDKVCVL